MRLYYRKDKREEDEKQSILARLFLLLLGERFARGLIASVFQFKAVGGSKPTAFLFYTDLVSCLRILLNKKYLLHRYKSVIEPAII